MPHGARDHVSLAQCPIPSAEDSVGTYRHSKCFLTRFHKKELRLLTVKSLAIKHYTIKIIRTRKISNTWSLVTEHKLSYYESKDFDCRWTSYLTPSLWWKDWKRRYNQHHESDAWNRKVFHLLAGSKSFPKYFERHFSCRNLWRVWGAMLLATFLLQIQLKAVPHSILRWQQRDHSDM